MFGNILPRREYQTVDQIRAEIMRSSALKTSQDKRANVSIGVIDDNKFAPMRNLQNHGYNLTEVGDVKRIQELERYSIILCDLMGVGAELGANDQGVHIIREIKSAFPTKVVLAYTGASMNTGIVRSARDSADELVRKDIDIAQWQSKLDEYIERVSDPIEIWLSMREHLVRRRINTLLLLRLEDAYVESFKARDPSLLHLNRVLDGSDQGARWRPVIGYLAANQIIRLVIEGLS